MADNNKPNSLQASMAKAKAGRAATEITLRCVELAGCVRLLRELAAGEVGARLEDPGHLRGHPADPAAHRRPPAARQVLRRTQVGPVGLSRVLPISPSGAFRPLAGSHHSRTGRDLTFRVRGASAGYAHELRDPDRRADPGRVGRPAVGRVLPAPLDASGPRRFGPRVDRGFEAAIEQLDEYFAGERRDFDLDTAAEGDEFQHRVWALIAAIPYGASADVRRTRRRTRRSVRRARGRRRRRQQPAVHRRAVPPRRRQGRRADRVCRRPEAQAVPARSRAGPARQTVLTCEDPVRGARRSSTARPCCGSAAPSSDRSTRTTRGPRRSSRRCARTRTCPRTRTSRRGW